MRQLTHLMNEDEQDDDIFKEIENDKEKSTKNRNIFDEFQDGFVPEIIFTQGDDDDLRTKYKEH
jgi:MFS family permease